MMLFGQHWWEPVTETYAINSPHQVQRIEVDAELGRETPSDVDESKIHELKMRYMLINELSKRCSANIKKA